MTRTVKLSILIPVYNEAKTVHRTVKRVLDVSFPCPVEVVIVDDASTDGTADIIDQLHDERLIKLRHPANRGKGAAIRTAVAAATGDFMVPLDADLETCFKLMPADLLRSLNIKSDGFGMEAEITGKLLARGIRPFEVPITYRARTREAGKKITWRDGVQAVWILGRIRLTKRPAR